MVFEPFNAVKVSRRRRRLSALQRPSPPPLPSTPRTHPPTHPPTLPPSLRLAPPHEERVTQPELAVVERAAASAESYARLDFHPECEAAINEQIK